MIGILAEKPSAMRNMAKALGGTSGCYNNEDFTIVAARGHLYTLDDPEKQVDKSLSAKYHQWGVANLPWDERDMHWKYKKNGNDIGGVLSTIKETLDQCDEVCIATDDDPTGEGELLAWEILDQLNILPRKWTRMYFLDESAKELQKAFVNRKPIASMDKDPDYIKAFYRSRWDFMSMQFTRIATACGDNHTTLRQGRLKSAMVLLVGDALKALNAYQKIPYYQNRFKDENGVIYTNPNEPNFKKKEDVPQTYHASSVTFDGSSMKSTAPPKLLDLAALSARLVRNGYTAKQITDTYQRMYESQVVSYPRTEDKVISPEQFAELLPLVDKIASVVGVDPKLLTHRTERSTHVKAGGAHGANRPGPSVPGSLAELSKFDASGVKGCAAAIYELLAKNYLATLAEDYLYESQKGHVTDYPDFKGTASVPKSMGWKQVYDAESDPDDTENAKGIGTQASPYIHEGFPPKPPTPTMKWLMTQLEKRDVGTGATRTSTYADVTTEKKDSKSPSLLKDTKGRITMTEAGEMSYRLLPGTHIGSLDMTEHVMQDMRDIAAGKKDPEVCLHEIQQFVIDDIETMRKNGIAMRKELRMGTSERCEGVFNGKEVSFKKSWGGHDFTDEECKKLLDGEEITFTYTKKDGTEGTATGSLGDSEYQGKKFFGFVSKQIDHKANMVTTDERYVGMFNGEKISFKRDWGGHHFTDEECEKLLSGEKLSFSAKSKAGKDYTASGYLGKGRFTDKKTGKEIEYYGFQLDVGNSDASGKPRIPDTWCQHTFTDEEKDLLETGFSIEARDFVSKKGNTFSAKLTYGKKDDGKMGLICEFI